MSTANGRPSDTFSCDKFFKWKFSSRFRWHGPYATKQCPLRKLQLRLLHHILYTHRTDHTCLVHKSARVASGRGWSRGADPGAHRTGGSHQTDCPSRRWYHKLSWNGPIVQGRSWRGNFHRETFEIFYCTSRFDPGHTFRSRMGFWIHFRSNLLDKAIYWIRNGLRSLNNKENLRSI